jgi:chemotaxis response regulator CheB
MVSGAPVIRVLVVDDEALMRKGFQRTFDAARDIDVAVAVPGGQTLQAAREIRPDVVPLDMLDIRMRPLAGGGTVRSSKVTGQVVDVHVNAGPKELDARRLALLAERARLLKPPQDQEGG